MRSLRVTLFRLFLLALAVSGGWRGMAAEPESVRPIKERLGQDAYSWSLYNELGLEYYRLRMYDEAIVAFKQALLVHGMSRQIKAEKLQQDARKEEIEAQNKQAALIKRQQENAAAAQMIGVLVGGLGGMGGLGGGLDAMAANMALQTAGGAAQAALTANGGEAVLRKDTGMLSDVQACREIASIQFNLGRAQYAKQAFSDAILAFGEARKTDPALIAAAYWTAEANYQQGRFAQSIEDLFTFLSVAPGSDRSACLLRAANAFRNLGMTRESERSLAEAVQPHLKTLTEAPDDPAALRRLGDIYAGCDQPERALGYYQRFLQSQTNDASALLAAAGVAYNANAFDTAIGFLDRLGGEETPQQVKSFAWYMKGLILLDKGADAEAKGAFLRAVSINTLTPLPTHVVAAKALGGDQEEGVLWLQRVLFENPFSPSACPNMYRLGRVHQLRGESAQAIELFARCLDVQPGYGPARRALDLLEKQLAPSREAALRKGDEAAGKKEFAGAIRSYAEAYRLVAPGAGRETVRARITSCLTALETPPPLTAQGMRCFLRGNAALRSEARKPSDIARAISEYRWALQDSPWSPVVLKHLAVAYMMNGQYKAATECLRCFLATGPKGAEAADAMDTLHRAEFQLEEQCAVLAAFCRGQ
ncbi:MAG: hypothetical protein RBT78_07080 [Kiritimatiellia bacterium]|nr:hypothetical protein [Kiritimatiellia bacterium]